jgi:hypothetical protein
MAIKMVKWLLCSALKWVILEGTSSALKWVILEGTSSALKWVVLEGLAQQIAAPTCYIITQDELYCES